MKIRYMSDLHIEFPWITAEWVPSIGEDVVVVAGDIGTGVRGIEWAIDAFRGRPVMYVLGNHEFYRHGWDTLIVQARKATAGTNVHVLEDDAVDIGGVRFLGATLWTDFALYGEERRTASMIAGRDALVDFQLIAGTDGYSLTPQATIERHERSRIFLNREIAASTLPVVVITHHSPSKANEHPEFIGKELGPCFYSTLDALFQPPVQAWISGHTHYSCVTLLNGIPLVSNQRGYPREGVRFSWDAMIEVASRAQSHE